MWCQKEKEFKELKEQCDGLVKIVNEYPEQIKNLQNQIDKMTRIAKYAGDKISCRMEPEYRAHCKGSWSYANFYTLYIYPDRSTELEVELPELTSEYIDTDNLTIEMTDCGLAKVVCNQYNLVVYNTSVKRHEFLIDLKTLKYIHTCVEVPVKNEEEEPETKSSGIDIRYQFDYSSDGTVNQLMAKIGEHKFNIIHLDDKDAEVLNSILKKVDMRD